MSYDGVLAGPGRSQTIPYVKGLAARGHAMALLSYEDPRHLADAGRVRAATAELDGLPWATLPRKGRRLTDLGAGTRALRSALAAHGADLVHARGYVPAFLAAMLGAPFVFDMRGFWPDERADGGLWSRRGLGYRLWKRIERTLLRRAASIVTLTARAEAEMERLGLLPEGAHVHVIPTCTDLDRFFPVPPSGRPPECRGEAPRYLILGATGTWYLRDEMLDLAARALERDPNAVLHVLTEDPPEPLLAGLAERGVAPARVLLRGIPLADVPAWISGAAAAILLIRPVWSKTASCPTKLGELLACGVPVIVNAGIGDVDRQLAGEQVGVTVTEFTRSAYDAALEALSGLRGAGESALAGRCRRLAEREFALGTALDLYELAYRDARASIAAARRTPKP